MSEFYQLDSTKITIREILFFSKNPIHVLLNCLVKWCNIRTPQSSDDPNVDFVWPFVVPTLPPEIIAKFAPLTQELSALGFCDPVFHQIQDHGTRTVIYWATFYHPDGKHVARIHNRMWFQVQKTDRCLFPVFLTQFTDDTFLISSSGKPDSIEPPAVVMNRLPKAPTSQLWEEHLKLVAASGKTIYPVQNKEEVIAVSETLHVLQRDFHLARGWFRPRKPEEQKEAETFASNVSAAAASGLEHGEVLAELEALHTKKPNWSNTLWMLVASIVLFIVIGASQWNWWFTLLLIPILFIHESGHWLMMKIFRYRNMRMFFIPLFGAAVTGQNWNIPGWKKALVYLAGPVPGIVLGVLVGFLPWSPFFIWLRMFGMLFVLINGLNLVPVLPLDGGQVLLAVLFCRNRWLDFSFRVLAIVGLFFAAAHLESKYFFFLGLLLAMGLPVSFKLGKVAAEMRREGVALPSAGDEQIPTETAQKIISAIKREMPQHRSNKMLATHTLNVFENLNARPPGLWATLGLLAIYAGSIALVAGYFFWTVHSVFSHIRLPPPACSVSCGQSERWPATRSGTNATPSGSVLIATFKGEGVAKLAFVALTNQVPESATLEKFGQSLLLSLPPNDSTLNQWKMDLGRQATNVFLATNTYQADVAFTFDAPSLSIATNLENELQQYFRRDEEILLIPPWSPEAHLPSFDKYRQARQTWQRIHEAMAETWNDPRMQALAKSFGKISLSDDRRWKAYSQAQADLTIKLKAEMSERLRNDPVKPVDPELLELYAKISDPDSTNQMDQAASVRQLADKLGGTAYSRHEKQTDASGLGADFGVVMRNGLKLQLRSMYLDNPIQGLPAFTDWLCFEGCTDIKYVIRETR